MKLPRFPSSESVIDNQIPKRKGYSRKMPRTKRVGTSKRYPSGASRSKIRTRRRCQTGTASARVAVPISRRPGQLPSGPLEDCLQRSFRRTDRGLHVTRAAVGQRLGEHVGHDELRLRLGRLLARQGRPAWPLAWRHHVLKGLELGVGCEYGIVMEGIEWAGVVTARDRRPLHVLVLVHEIEKHRPGGLPSRRPMHHNAVDA